MEVLSQIYTGEYSEYRQYIWSMEAVGLECYCHDVPGLEIHEDGAKFALGHLNWDDVPASIGIVDVAL
jgi:hypothetical protein